MSTNAARTTTIDTAGFRSTHITRSLLGWGVVAGPFTVVVSVGQGLTRDGFELTRHQWSLLSNGDLGWIQVANFILTGTMIVAFAVGLRRALATGVASSSAPRLVAAFGASMITAGIFKADPGYGFPVGTPEVPGHVTTSGIVHLVVGGIGFVAVTVACFILARRQARDGARGLAWGSRFTGVAFLGGFLCVASGPGSVAANVLFTFGVVLVYSWITVAAVHHYRELADSRIACR